MPVVSLLMVFHRDSPYLRPALASALSQTWRDLEVVLVDNGTGLSAEALGELGRDPRLHWVRLPRNEGIPGGHNAGIAAAQGEFIALQDYDDLSEPDRIVRQIDALRRHPEVAIVAGHAVRIDEGGRSIGQVFCLPRAHEHPIYTPYGGAFVTPTVLGRRELFQAVPYRVEFPFAADLDFQARVVERWKTAVLPEVLLRYRWHSAQTTQQRSREIEQSRCVIQLLSARRRAGRPEEVAAALTAIRGDSTAESWRRGSRLCRAEGEAVFAAFQARRSFACDRSAPSFLKALRLGLEALRAAPRGRRGLTARMFFTGPVRALQLHPVGKNVGGPASG